MNSRNLRALESFCKAKPQRLKSSKTGLLILLGILFLAVTSAACGKHKAQVKAPLPRPSPPTAAKKAESAKLPPVPSKPPIADKSPQTAAAELPTPEIEAIAQATELPRSPSIRIGLTTAAREIRISSSGDYYLMEKVPEASRQLLQGEIRVRIEQEAEEAAVVYQIQVASFARLGGAKDLQKKLSEAYPVPVSIRENAATSTNQVRVGEFSTRDEAQDFLKTLVESGYRDAFVIKETVLAGSGQATLALRGPQNFFRLSSAGFLFLPSSSTSFLRVDGKPYRGLLDVVLNKSRRITVVNQLETEEYLLGVVPAEMSPTAYPEFAALAALSIAARTYALHNMGKYSSEGFDLNNDTKTQVYGGVAAEKAVTDEAVRQTSGLAIYYEDKLIDAMYMSTCGGRTEDFSNVFDAAPVPYLKSVLCAIESGPEKGELILEGTHKLDQAFLADDGSLANRNLELARILDVIPSDSETSVEYFAGQTRRAEAVQWIAAAGQIAQLSPRRDRLNGAADIDTRSGFFRYAAESIFGSDEIKRKISAGDAAYYVGNLKDGDTVPEAARHAVAFLMQRGLWRPYSDNTVRANDLIRRGDALALLLRCIESARPEILRKGTFVEAHAPRSGETTDTAISVKWGNKAQEFGLSSELRLFRVDLGRTTPVSSLRVIGNEKMSFHVNPSGTIDFVEIELSPTGASSDRYSPAAAWDITLARPSVAEKLRGSTGNIGEFQDLKPFRIGNSGRVVQIQAVGSRSSVVLNGYKVRNALGLRDTLFTITREHHPDGSIASFTFYGRGFGHGVGLCQVGAFGMARAGRSYDEILKTYYQGVQIRKAY